MKKHAFWKIWGFLLILIAVGAGLSFLPSFCDWYDDSVYAHIANGLGRLTAPIPVPLGEIIVYIGIVLLVLSLIFLILLLCLHKKRRYRRFAAGWYKSLLMTLTVFGLIYVINWLIPFRGTVLGQKVSMQEQFSFSQVHTIREYLYTELNAAAELVPTDADGHVIFPDAQTAEQLMHDALHGIADEFPRLAGYLPPVKTSLCSDLLDRMGSGGFTYPYTTEATHVRYSLTPVYQPVLDAHELCHHKGYYKENEADFLAELALSQSEDPFMRFCGLFYMSDMADQAYSEAVQPIVDRMIADGILPPRENGLREFAAACAKHMPHESQYTSKVWQIYNESNGVLEERVKDDNRPLDNMPAVEQVVTEVSDKGWEIQADVLKENIYDGAAELLLHYFSGKLPEKEPVFP